MPGFHDQVMWCANMNFSDPISDQFNHPGEFTAGGDLAIGTGVAAPGQQIAVGTLTGSGGIVISYLSPDINIDGSGAGTATTYQADAGTATPAANILNVVGAGTVSTSAAGNTLTITGTGSGISTLTGNSGGAISPAAGNINIVTSNSTVTFVGSGSTLTQDFNLTNLVFGSTLPSLTSGDFNVGVGSLAIPSITSATSCTAVGYGAGVSTTTGNSNTFIGFGTGQTASTSQQNTAVGASSLAGATTGVGGHTSVGYDSLSTVTTGVFNVAIGYQAGKSLTSADSHNICIGNTGTAGDNNVMRLGAQGTGTRQVSVTYLAGQLNLLSGLVVKVTTPGAYPYTTLITDYLILVDTSSARTITPMASPTAGQVLVIKDSVGSAATNNITITPSGKNIDGAASTTINIAYGSVTIVYGGSEWHIV